MISMGEAAEVAGPWYVVQFGLLLVTAFVVWQNRAVKRKQFSGNGTGGVTMKSDSRIAKHRGYRMEDVEDVLRIAKTENFVSLASQPVAMFYDMDALKETLLELRAAFPSNFEHAIAIKSNPLPPFLRLAVQLGFGLEAASLAEVKLALREGCDPRKVLFDCPAKSRADIRTALARSVHINADSMQELERIDVEHAALAAQHTPSASRIGVRINPLVGLGSIAALSVSGTRSKFGVALTAANEREVEAAFRRFPWLVALHVHVGSQGCSLQQHADGARKAVELATRIDNEHGRGRVQAIDIGGGLPVNFDSAQVSPTFSHYAAILREEVSELFSRPDLTVLTEYGRSVSAKAGWAACSVEYVKEVEPGRAIAVIQAGADLFLRACYCPASFALRVTAHDPASGAQMLPASKGAGAERTSGEDVLYDVAGPLCFAGDVLATDQLFPKLGEGDVLVVHDAGANTLSLFSRHCSRQAPPVYGYYRPADVGKERVLGTAGRDRSGEALAVALLKPQEEMRHVLQFWGEEAASQSESLAPTANL